MTTPTVARYQSGVTVPVDLWAIVDVQHTNNGGMVVPFGIVDREMVDLTCETGFVGVERA